MAVSAPTTSKKPRQRSARGDGEKLREEIVAEARRLMAAAPTADAVSMRAIAQAVGVTTPSLYLHFPDKAELLSAVVLDVMTELDAAMVAAGASASSPLERLRAFGLAYVDFAVAHPEHYRLATMDPCAKPDIDSVLAEGCWAHFNDAVKDCIDSGVFPAGDSVPITLDLWAAAHGLAALWIAKPFMPWGEPLEIVARRVLSAAVFGHTVPDPEAALAPHMGLPDS